MRVEERNRRHSAGSRVHPRAMSVAYKLGSPELHSIDKTILATWPAYGHCDASSPLDTGAVVP
eukprot:scaffold108748_cov36-Tisochrysis_lutea.AAC.3